MDDTRIVDLYLQRNESAIRESAEKYGARLRFLADGIVCDRQTAEECENDTYLNAWNAIPPHEPRQYLYAFLARITRHLALNACRSRRADLPPQRRDGAVPPRGRPGAVPARRRRPHRRDQPVSRLAGSGKAKPVCAPVLVSGFRRRARRALLPVPKQGQNHSLPMPHRPSGAS